MQSNHLSYSDTPVLFGVLPFQFRIVARHDLFKLPFIGWHLTRSGQVTGQCDQSAGLDFKPEQRGKNVEVGNAGLYLPRGWTNGDGPSGRVF